MDKWFFEVYYVEKVVNDKEYADYYDEEIIDFDITSEGSYTKICNIKTKSYTDYIDYYYKNQYRKDLEFFITERFLDLNKVHYIKHIEKEYLTFADITLPGTVIFSGSLDEFIDFVNKYKIIAETIEIEKQLFGSFNYMICKYLYDCRGLYL